jgi:hypothetical protein
LLYQLSYAPPNSNRISTVDITLAKSFYYGFVLQSRVDFLRSENHTFREILSGRGLAGSFSFISAGFISTPSERADLPVCSRISHRFIASSHRLNTVKGRVWCMFTKWDWLMLKHRWKARKNEFFWFNADKWINSLPPEKSEELAVYAQREEEELIARAKLFRVEFKEEYFDDSGRLNLDGWTSLRRDIDRKKRDDLKEWVAIVTPIASFIVSVLGLLVAALALILHK